MEITWKKIIEHFVYKITSGRLILTVIIGLVYAYLACNNLLDESRINEITLIIIYAYFNKSRLNGNN